MAASSRSRISPNCRPCPAIEVVPLGVVEEAIIDNQIDLSRPSEARRLAQILGVDAVVIGSVTDYTPYYPPRCGLRVEWYAANPGFHEIPPGYGLPWGTPEEEYIPEPLVFESEFALAKAQLATQTPACDLQPSGSAATAAATGRTGAVSGCSEPRPQRPQEMAAITTHSEGGPQGQAGNDAQKAVGQGQSERR